jgi:AcrR family transcriptional regulator
VGSKYTKRYTEEFKRDAIALVDSSGETVTAVARELGMFHFASKQALADAVCAQGHEVTRRAVAHSTGGGACALQVVVDITHALVPRLDDCVRAASRLAYEVGGRDAWYGVWLPSLHAVSIRAERERELQPGVEAESFTVLASSLVAAAETAAWQACARVGTPVSNQLARVWGAVLEAIRSPWCAHALRPEGSHR